MNIAFCVNVTSVFPVVTSSYMKRIFLESSYSHGVCVPHLHSSDLTNKVCLSMRASAKPNMELLNYDYERNQRTSVQEMVDLLHRYAKERLLEETKAAHGYILRHGFMDDVMLIFLNHVMHAYSKCSCFELARKVFDTMSQRNVFSWTVMIVGCSENGLLNESFKYFSEMQKCGIQPDAFAYSAVLSLCVSLCLLDLGEMLHAQIITKGFILNIVVCTSLITMYAKLGDVDNSFKVFSNVTNRNEVSWNAMISGFSDNGLYLKAFEIFRKMMKGGFIPDVYSFVCVSKAVGMLGDVHKGKLVHMYASDLNLESNVHVGTALIDMYARCGSLCDARSLFVLNFSGCRLNMPWNAIIAAYSRCKCSKDALEVFVEMIGRNIEPDVYTFCSVLNVIADMKCLWLLKEVHAVVLKTRYSTVLSVENAVVDSYSKCKSLEDVKKVFDGMKQRDLVSWTALIGAYCELDALGEALDIFSQMRIEGHKPNQFTISTMLNSCSGNCQLELGQQLHSLIYKSGLITDNCISGALIDMYAKCGIINDARKAFDLISSPDIISWTSIISGYALHGSVPHALQLFTNMQKLNINANSVTMLCLLSACSHAGMVQEGLELFWSMKDEHDLEPEMEHYACLVDILGRAGHLNAAYDFINSAPIQVNDMVWETLLAACRIHGQIELGEISARKIFSSFAGYSSAHVLLSNIYMENGKIKDGLRLRMEMKKKGFKKEAGYSSISLEGIVHKFYAGDDDHPMKDEIYMKLAELQKMIKAFGYAPDPNIALYCGDSIENI